MQTMLLPVACGTRSYRAPRVPSYLPPRSHPPSVLYVRYAMPSTDIASLRSRYAMPGTDIAHHATSLRSRYAMPGTDIAHHTTRLFRFIAPKLSAPCPSPVSLSRSPAC
eukprot:2668742-Rhodomonas_salina.1